jgi:hypothetical protein
MTCSSEGRENVTHKERSGWPATSRTEENIAKVRQIVRENCRLSGTQQSKQTATEKQLVKSCWRRFSQSTSVSPANLHSTNCSTVTIIYHLGLVQ